MKTNWFPLFNQLFVLHMWSKFAYVSNYVFEMNAIWNPYIYFLLKYTLGLLLILISKSWRCPRGPGMPFLDICAEGGLFISARVFFLMYDAIHGWMMGQMDGWVTWWKKLHEKRPWHPLLYVMSIISVCLNTIAYVAFRNVLIWFLFMVLCSQFCLSFPRSFCGLMKKCYPCFASS